MRLNPLFRWAIDILFPNIKQIKNPNQKSIRIQQNKNEDFFSSPMDSKSKPPRQQKKRSCKRIRKFTNSSKLMFSDPFPHRLKLVLRIRHVRENKIKNQCNFSERERKRKRKTVWLGFCKKQLYILRARRKGELVNLQIRGRKLKTVYELNFFICLFYFFW